MYRHSSLFSSDSDTSSDWSSDSESDVCSRSLGGSSDEYSCNELPTKTESPVLSPESESDPETDEELKIAKRFRLVDPRLSRHTVKSARRWKDVAPLTRHQKRALSFADDPRKYKREILLPHKWDNVQLLLREERLELLRKIADDRRRIQEKLRRQKARKAAFKENMHKFRSRTAMKLLQLGCDEYQDEIDMDDVPEDIKKGWIVCKACGLPGHMKTNKTCPLSFSNE